LKAKKSDNPACRPGRPRPGGGHGTGSKGAVAGLLGALLCVCLASPARAGNQLDLYADLRATEIQTQIFVQTAAANGVTRIIPSLTAADGSVFFVTDKETYFPAWQGKINSGYDALASLIQNAHAVGIEVYPQAIIHAGGRIVANNPQWESLDRFGAPGGSANFNAMSFAYPAARQAKTDLMMDLVNNYDLDGVYLDYTRYWEGFGYDQPIIDEALATYGFDPRNFVPPSSPLSPGSTQYQQFAALRAQSVTNWVQEFRQAVDASGRNVRIGTLADHRWDLKFDTVTQGRDFPTWAQTGLIDDVFLANYTEVPINGIRSVVQNVRGAVGPGVTLKSTLTTWNNHLTTQADFFEATLEGLAGGADNVWIYREDFLAGNQLYDEAKATSEKIDRLINVSQFAVGTTRFDAAAPVGDPVSQGWSLAGSAMPDQGLFLLQDNTAVPGEQSGEYSSPLADPGLMNNATGNYAIEFRVRPLDNLVPSIANSRNLSLSWADDLNKYNLTVDLDTDDGGAGTTGAIKYGTQFSNAITGINWSVPHTVMVAYHADDSNFMFYLDGAFVDYVAASAVGFGGTDPALLDRVLFGDGSLGGSDVAAEWYFVNVYNIDGRLISDINGDGFVGLGDLNVVLGNWNQAVTPGDTASGDISGDGFVGIGDLNLVLADWNVGFPPSAASAVPEPNAAAVFSVLLFSYAGRRGRGGGDSQRGSAGASIFRECGARPVRERAGTVSLRRDMSDECVGSVSS
jgi:Glycosyl hydrolase-like 10